MKYFKPNLFTLALFIVSIIFVSCNKEEDSSSNSDLSTVTDKDGNIYQTVIIGTQSWMTENLKVTHYTDGSEITLKTEGWEELGNNDTDKVYCCYDNNDSTGCGFLYTYAAATNGDNSGNNVQGICPEGWHLPDDEDWDTLVEFISKDGHNGTEGTALKASTGWTYEGIEGNGTDDYGFSALPGGCRWSDSTFDQKDIYGFWWSSTENGSSYAYLRNLGLSNVSLNSSFANKSSGFSVRCVKDND